MNTDATVLSHLAGKFTIQTENLASEALAFILQRSASARLGVTEIANKFGFHYTDDLTFETQLSNDVGTRPDLIGKDRDGTPELLIEAKFWAGLTLAQPVEYLNYSLPPSGGLLLFVAPERRLHTLWSELLRRAKNDQTHTVVAGAKSYSVRVGSNILALTSWRELLKTLTYQVEKAGDSKSLADLQQLTGLCDRMDDSAFLPLGSEEMTATLGQRVVQFCDIAIVLIERLISDGHADRGKYKAVGWRGGYGRFILFKGYFAVIAFSAPNWSKWGESPLWLGVAGQDGKPSAKVRDALTRASIDFMEDNESHFCYIPIRLKTGAEQDKVIEDAMIQIVHVAENLPLANLHLKVEPTGDSSVAGSYSEPASNMPDSVADVQSSS